MGHKDLTVEQLNTFRFRDGPYRGKKITRVPKSYLKKVAREQDGDVADLARMEMNRRGTILNGIDITYHAIDRASVFCLKHWRRTRRDREEGIATWLSRMTVDAISEGQEVSEGRYRYEHMVFVIATDAAIPTLVTVMNAKHGK